VTQGVGPEFKLQYCKIIIIIIIIIIFKTKTSIKMPIDKRKNDKNSKLFFA
jgi:hypothetical protein